MATRWWTLVVGALVAASAVFWGLRLFVKSPPVPSGALVATAGPVGQGDLTRLLGADAPPPAAAPEPPPDARFQLIGVVTPRSAAAAREGLALIAVDGKPAKAFRVGAVVDGQTVLKAVAARGAQLGLSDGAVQVSLTLVPPPPAATGALPSAQTPLPAAVPFQPQAQAQPQAGGSNPPGALPGMPQLHPGDAPTEPNQPMPMRRGGMKPPPPEVNPPMRGQTAPLS